MAGKLTISFHQPYLDYFPFLKQEDERSILIQENVIFLDLFAFSFAKQYIVPIKQFDAGTPVLRVPQDQQISLLATERFRSAFRMTADQVIGSPVYQRRDGSTTLPRVQENKYLVRIFSAIVMKVTM
jgi:hypothetical protein